MFNNKRIEKLENDISKLRAENEELSKSVKVLERILRYGRGVEPTAIFDYDWYTDKWDMCDFKNVMRLYIDGREWTIEGVGKDLASFCRHIIESVTLSNNIATVVVDNITLKQKNIFAVDYMSGTYICTGVENYEEMEVKESE